MRHALGLPLVQREDPSLVRIGNSGGVTLWNAHAFRACGGLDRCAGVTDGLVRDDHLRLAGWTPTQAITARCLTRGLGVDVQLEFSTTLRLEDCMEDKDQAKAA